MRLKLVPAGTRIDFFRWANVTKWGSIGAMLASVVLVFVMGLNFGIDFKGGTTIRTQSALELDVGAYRARLSGLGLGDITITEVNDPAAELAGRTENVALIRIEQQSGEEAVSAETVSAIKDALRQIDPDMEFPLVDSVGPKVSGELIQAAVIAVLIAIAAVLFYIWLRFEWQFSLGAVGALVHDVVLTIGIFSLLQIKFDLAIIAALLTIVGYSLNDTVVVYDRVRENLRKFKKEPLRDLLIRSINETLSRTVMTSVTTLIALLSLFVLGGDVIRGFVFAMIWGVIVGTYSSVFVASSMLLRLGVKRDWSKTSEKSEGGIREVQPVIDHFLGALAHDGLPVLLAAVAIAGLVRGFSGFGTALIYVPLASTVMPPIWVLTTLMVFDIIGIGPLIPRATRDGRIKEVVILVTGALVGMPAGFLLLTRIGSDEFRLLISVSALVLVALLASGWRLKRALNLRAKAGVGVVAGMFGGATGAPGPPIILLYLSGPDGPEVVRANNMLFLLLFDIVFLAVLAASGYLEVEPVMIGLILVVPYALAGWLGQLVFDPRRERAYRIIAYVIITLSALIGLPFFL